MTSAHDDADRPSLILISSDDDVVPPWMAFLDAPHNDNLCIELRARKAGAHTRWAARLDQTVGRARAPVVLIAHGASCLAVAWWARLSPSCYVSPVAGAIFLAPTDPFGAELTGQASPFEAPNTLLPFPSIVVGGEAPAEGNAVAAGLAQNWGSRFADAGGFAPRGAGGSRGAWHEGERTLDRVLAAISEHRALPSVASSGNVAFLHRGAYWDSSSR